MGKHKKKKTRRDVAEIARENLEQIIGEKLTGEPLDQLEEPQPHDLEAEQEDDLLRPHSDE